MRDDRTDRWPLDHGNADRSAVIPRPQVLASGRVAPALDPAFDCGQHGERHLAERPEWLMAVLPGAEMRLGECIQAVPLECVDQERYLYPVADREREGLEQLAACCELAGQWLREAREQRKVKVDQRPKMAARTRP